MSTSAAPVSLRALDARGWGLQVEYQWGGDRFTHQVMVVDPGGATHRVLEAIEGSADDPWPASPPLQQLSSESIGGRPALLGVGGAGRSHWSASVSVESSLGEPAEIGFDLACRTPTPPGPLESSYRLASPAEGWVWEESAGSLVADGFQPLSGNPLTLTLSAAKPGERGQEVPLRGQFSSFRRGFQLQWVAADRVGATGWESREGCLRFRAATCAERYPATLRWGYRLRLLPSP